MKKRLAGILVLGCLMQTAGRGQNDPRYDEKIPPTLLRQDFLLFRDTLQKSHPGLYRYRPKAVIDHLFDSCYRSISDSETVLAFFTRVAFMVAAIGDGHTNCNPPRSAVQELINKERFFPLLLLFIHSRGYVYCSNQKPDIRGAELLSINGRPMHEILERVYAYVQSDAFITSHKDTELPDGFNPLYRIIYGPSDEYDVTYQPPGGKVQRATLHASAFNDLRCPPPALFRRPDKYLGLSYREGGVAVLTIKTFFDVFLQQTHENFAGFLDSAFTDMKNKGVRKLLIDIRRNQGGNDHNGELLYAYLTSAPFRYYAAQETTTETFLEKDHPDLAVQQPRENNYAGKVFVLADGRSFSASAEFSSIVKTNRRGKFIGDMVGGGYYGNTSGDEVHVILPATHLDIRLPLVKYTMAVQPLPKGVGSIEPDFPLYPTISEIIENKDGQLERAIRIVEDH
ncbi:MAG TPA: S41 family peptidase [Puia sp.]|nr:S41 family peptidase [Puia sp.]